MKINSCKLRQPMHHKMDNVKTVVVRKIICFFIFFINLYFRFTGQELAPFPLQIGCQRVIEPGLSPLLYKLITQLFEEK